MNRVKDKVCIVTGAALGIGRACALRLAQEARASHCSTYSMSKAKNSQPG